MKRTLLFLSMLVVGCAIPAKMVPLDEDQKLEVSDPKYIEIETEYQFYTGQALDIRKDTVFLDGRAIPKASIARMEIADKRNERNTNLFIGTIYGVIGYSLLIGLGVLTYKFLN